MSPFIKRIVIPLFVTTFLAGVGLSAPAYPLKRSANNRYLVDQNNQPVLLVGDSPHALFANLSIADATTYLQSRGANGFNALWCEVLVTPDTGGRANLSTYDGILPFTSPNDISTPNPAYFARVDQMIAIAAANGLTVVLDTFETHYLQTFLEAQTATKMFNYGVFLGNRYKNTPNIVWMTGNDFQYWNTHPNNNNLIKELLRGIASVDSNHLQTLQLHFPYSGSLDNTLIAPYVTLNGVYNYYVTYDEVLKQYNKANYLPVYLQEAAYEDESNFELGTPNLLRRQAYWTVLAGGLGGQMYGHLNIWRFSNGWQNSLNSTGARQLGHWRTFFTSKAWYNLVPDQTHTVVTAGYGTYRTAASQTFGSANDYVTTARTPDGTLVLAYTPVAHTLTVDMTKLAGSVTARWFDPAAGTYTSISGSPFSNTGTRNFTTPGNNSAGAGNGDWVLVLETSGGGNPNTAPTISNISDQSTTVGTATGAIPFTVGDAQTAAGSLTVSASSGNSTLVPNGNIVFGGSGANRTVTVTPAANQTGSATITINVSDGSLTASDTFVLTVNAVATGGNSFANAAAITIPGAGVGSPYPSIINVSGLSGTISTVTVRLHNLSHTWPDDIDILLVSPTGQKVLLLSDAGGSGALNNVTLTLADGAATSLSDNGQLATGTFKPTNFETTTDTFAAPAPASPYGTTLATFNGQTANGVWSLYVMDDGSGDQGSLAGGWSLTFTTTGGSATTPTISDIANQATTVNTATAAIPFTVNDADTAVGNLALSGSSSNPTLVPNGNIVFGGSGANRTVTVTPAANQTGTATITVTVSDGSLTASDTFVLTVSAVATGGNSFANAAVITIPDVGAGSPYPSIINVSGLSGTISGVAVRLNNLSHTWPDDIDVLLVSPTGQKVLLMSDAGGGSDLNNVTLTLTDSAATSLSDNGQLASGTFKPTNFETTTDTFAAPAPASPYGTTLATFNGQTANGAWSLYVMEDGPGDQGSFAGGWNLTITTTGGSAAAPTISNIADQSTTVNTATAAIPFTVNDADTAVSTLTVSGSSSNPTLVPNGNIVFGGSGANRMVTVTPAANQTGAATITVTVSDGSLQANDTFVLTASAAATGGNSFTNAAVITIPDLGAGNPYPSIINVSGLSGTISGVAVTLRSLSHTWKADVDVLLVGPGGQKALLMSDAGASYTASGSVTITFSDAAAASLPASAVLSSGTFKPTDFAPADTFPSPAPAGPYATTLATFNGQTANGAWSLYVMDDGSGDQGTIASGWSLTITTAGAAGKSSVSIQEPPRITLITIDDQRAVRVTVSGAVGFGYALEASSDLINWTKVDAQEIVTGSVEFSEQPTNAIRFYRAVSLAQ